MIQGHDEREGAMHEFRSTFPDFHVEINDLLASEDKVVPETTDTMSHGNEFTRVPPTDVGADIRAMAEFLVENAKIKQHREHHDRQEHHEKLGVTHAEDINGR